MESHLGSTDFSIIISPAVYSGLSADHKACLAQLSTPEYARTIGTFWDNADALGKRRLLSQNKTIYPPPADVQAKLEADLANVEAFVLSTMSDKLNKTTLYTAFKNAL
jgi:hypothetical protein